MKREFYQFKKLDRAVNNWKSAKHAAYQLVLEDDYPALRKALAQIGRHGYGAQKGVDLMDSLTDTDFTEFLLKTASEMIAISRNLKITIKD